MDNILKYKLYHCNLKLNASQNKGEGYTKHWFQCLSNHCIKPDPCLFYLADIATLLQESIPQKSYITLISKYTSHCINHIVVMIYYYCHYAMVTQ